MSGRAVALHDRAARDPVPAVQRCSGREMPGGGVAPGGAPLRSGMRPDPAAAAPGAR
jgi:hypothetical protein